MPRADQFTYLLRILNTNVNGKMKVPYALRIIKGIGRRFAILCCKIAQIDINRRAGDLTEEEINKISDIFAKPTGKSLKQHSLASLPCQPVLSPNPHNARAFAYFDLLF